MSTFSALLIKIADKTDTELSIKFIMLINVKMPTIVGILTFISVINTTYRSLKARKVFIFKNFSCYEHL